MNGFHAAAVRHAWDETADLRGLRLDVAPEVLGSHRRSGQYLTLRVGAQEGFFALASAPGQSTELLVKRGSAIGDAVAALAEGTEVETSEVEGKGYPIEESAGGDLLLFAAGSGITPIRAAIRQLLATRERFGRVLLFYGQRRPGDFAYRTEHADWAQAGIELVPVVSRPDGAEWSGATGHVQDAVLAVRPSVERATALLCGMKGMVSGVTAALGTLGLPRERVFLNY
ncbi:MAG: oxidoreductase [Myxococcales bacterium]|nr:oxidoreductase [Myxococcales bacterium]